MRGSSTSHTGELAAASASVIGQAIGKGLGDAEAGDVRRMDPAVLSEFKKAVQNAGLDDGSRLAVDKFTKSLKHLASKTDYLGFLVGVDQVSITVALQLLDDPAATEAVGLALLDLPSHDATAALGIREVLATAMKRQPVGDVMLETFAFSEFT